jgi:hypothetical protein
MQPISAGSNVNKYIEIKSKDFWFKVVEFLQQNWALIEEQRGGGCIVYFVHDASGVFDQISFSSVSEAKKALRLNGFIRFADDTEAQSVIAPPEPPYFKTEHPNGAIYSSGRYWS